MNSPEVIPASAIQAVARAFRLPDVSAIDVERLSPADCATLLRSLGDQEQQAQLVFEAMMEPIRAAMNAAERRVRAAIHESGGRALAHDTFDVRLEQGERRDKRFTRQDFERLCDLVPVDVLKDAIVVTETRGIPAGKIAEAIASGDDAVHVSVDLRKLDVIARDYGGDVREIVARCSPRVPIGPEKLVIEPRESALKLAGAS